MNSPTAYPELRAANTPANMTRVAKFDTSVLTQSGDNFAPYAAKIDGACQGTTEQILEWAGRKWWSDRPEGPDLAKADAIVESWWRQGSVNPDGPTYGINQVKCGVWPECEKARQSTAFAADYAMAVMRMHYDGQSWLPQIKGNFWQAVAAWECGCDTIRNNYADLVKTYLSSKAWRIGSPNYCTPNSNPAWFCKE